MTSKVAAAPIARPLLPWSVIGRFVARRTLRTAMFWGLAFAAFVAGKAVGYGVAYPNPRDRVTLAASFSNNIGLSAIFGTPHDLVSVGGFTAWNTLNAMVIIGSIWAFLTATKIFRGEEDAGRWELLLAGPTNARRAAVNALAGLVVALVGLYTVMAIGFILVGKAHAVGFSLSACLFFALAATAGASLFMTIGSLASQLMPTRARAAMLSAAIFGASFLVRAMGDITSAHWLLDVSPLGWIEQLRPLYGSRPLWLLPLAALVLLLATMTLVFAGRRDVGASIFADHDTAWPRTRLLGSPFWMAVRLTRANSLSWLMAISFVAVFFSLLTRSATQVFQSSAAAEHAVSRLAHTSQASFSLIATKTFLGIVFFFVMLLIMCYTASALGSLREDEAEGYLDNLLVRPVGRLRWLWGRLALIGCIIVAAGLLAAVGVWAGESSQHAGVPFWTLLPAGINAMAPGALALGIGVVVFGFVPRLTAAATYGVIVWSFLIQMVSSGVNLSHWLLDTTIFYHIPLVPAAAPNWRVVVTFGVLGLLMSLLGSWRFVQRDLVSE